MTDLRKIEYYVNFSTVRFPDENWKQNKWFDRFLKKNEYYVRLEIIIIDKKAGEYVMSQELEKTYWNMIKTRLWNYWHILKFYDIVFATFKSIKYLCVCMHAW